MKLQIDNFDGRGLQDYTRAIDAAQLPTVVRQKDQPWKLTVSLVSDGPDFVVPVNGARITLGRTNGRDIFSGHLIAAPTYEFLGWHESGPAYRYKLVALSDDALLNSKRLAGRSPFVDRSAGEALRQVTQNVLPGVFDVSAVQDLDILPLYQSNPEKTWSEHAAELALLARASYRTDGTTLVFAPIGSTVYPLDETDQNFSPEALTLEPQYRALNDVTVIGDVEPQAYVKDYFVGDGLSMKFYLSQNPFIKPGQVTLTEEFKGGALDPTRWNLVDPQNAVGVAVGTLVISGGTGADGQTAVCFAEQIEMSGGIVLQHGDVTFTGASAGVLGGLYAGNVSIANCVAGFRTTPNGPQCNLQAIINGNGAGPIVTTAPGHRYVLTTRLYAMEVYRREQVFHSSAHPAGAGRGGTGIPAAVRFVLELHDIDPASPASLVTASTVLFDGVVDGAPGFCTYGLVNAINMHATIAFTRIAHTANAEIRSMLPNQTYRTRLSGALADGAECTFISGPALDFFPQYVPAVNELIEVHYRGAGRATARVTDPETIAAAARPGDDGIRGAVRRLKAPSARTTTDCENAALALLDEGKEKTWKGEYRTWSDFLPGGAQDIYPGDALAINVPSRDAVFMAIVREVEVTVADLLQDHCLHRIAFSDSSADDFCFAFEAAGKMSSTNLTALAVSQVGQTFLPSLTAAVIIAVTSTTVTIDAGTSPRQGGGFEVRWSDFGWGMDNDRNLAARTTARTFTVPRLSRTEDYFLRQYDGSNPPRYSRYTAALHVAYPY